MFFVDKYSPHTKNEAIFHKKELETLQFMAKDDSIPHIIFYGNEGCGKKTLIKLFLEMIYDERVHKLNDSIYKVSGSGNNTSDVVIKQSNYHIVIDPTNTNFDRYLIQDVVKEYAKKIPLTIFSSPKYFKTVLINNVDNLSYYAQTSLRRTMEKFSGTCRFIMWCKSLSRVIDPIRSRCYCFRIPSPLRSELFEMMVMISYKESIKLSLDDYIYILDSCKGNIKKVLWMLQLKKFGESYLTSYDKTINDIVKQILPNPIKNDIDENNNVNNICDINAIISIRDILYKIMITNVTGTNIIKSITNKIFRKTNMNEKSKFFIAEVAAKFEHNLIRGRREIMHLEAFIMGLMYIINKYNKLE